MFSETTDRIVEGLPKVQGGDQFFSRNATKVVQNATNLIKDFDDEFVSIEHLLFVSSRRRRYRWSANERQWYNI